MVANRLVVGRVIGGTVDRGSVSEVGALLHRPLGQGVQGILDFPDSEAGNRHFAPLSCGRRCTSFFPQHGRLCAREVPLARSGGKYLGSLVMWDTAAGTEQTHGRFRFHRRWPGWQANATLTKVKDRQRNDVLRPLSALFDATF